MAFKFELEKMMTQQDARRKELKKSAYDPYDILDTFVPDLEYTLDRHPALEEAERNGLLVVEADDNTLQLDFDTEEQWDVFLNNRLPSLIGFLNVTRVWWTESKNGNKHVYVRLDSPLPIDQRIALQAALGSDPVRELLNIARVQQNIERPVLFFEKADAVEVVVYAVDGYQPQLTAGLNATALEGYGGQVIVVHPEESEFLAQQTYSRDEIAAAFRVDPADLLGDDIDSL